MGPLDEVSKKHNASYKVIYNENLVFYLPQWQNPYHKEEGLY